MVNPLAHSNEIYIYIYACHNRINILRFFCSIAYIAITNIHLSYFHYEKKNHVWSSFKIHFVINCNKLSITVNGFKKAKRLNFIKLNVIENN